MVRPRLALLLLAPAFAAAAPAAPPAGPIAFELVRTSGIDFVTNSGRTPARHQPETMVSGAAFLDYDGDGLLDVFLVNGATLPQLDKSRPVYWNRLYRNLGNWRFEDVTEKAGVRGRGFDLGVAVADYDNDGRPDILVLGLRENTLYHNEGDGSFRDVSEQAGLRKPDPDYGTLWSVAAAFLDYDNDGRLDIFVSNYCVWDPKTEPRCVASGANDYCHPSNYRGLPNSLYHNEGDGRFRDVSVASGIRKSIGKGMGLGVADFDGDGFTDVFVANDTEPNFLFKNKGNGTFEEIGFLAGVAFPEAGRPLSGMGADARDIDDDGRPDIFHTALSSETMPVFRNQGGDAFVELTARAGVSSLSLSRAGWANAIVDFDNDGRKDLFVAGGDVMDPGGQFREKVRQTNLVLANLGDFKFKDATDGAGTEFATKRATHRGAAFGDLDNDGRIDVLVTALDEGIELWRNVSPAPSHWLAVRTIGTRSNRDGIGARLVLTTPSGSRHSHVNTAVGYGGASDVRVHFGLGPDTTISQLEILWPSGARQLLENVAVDQVVTVTEPAK
jgi:enediyne biosynthesis protein E4